MIPGTPLQLSVAVIIPVIAMPLAAAVATTAVLGRSRDEVVEPVAAPGKLVVSAPPGDRELGPVASVR